MNNEGETNGSVEEFMSTKHSVSKQTMRKRGSVEENAKPSRFVDNVEDVLDAEIAATRLREINEDPEKLVSGEKLTAALPRLVQ